MKTRSRKFSCTRKVVQARSENDCVFKSFRVPKGEKIACGEQGCAYKIQPTEHPNTVLKITKFKDSKSEQQWINESCVASKLGHAGIAPKIFDSFVCQNQGFILMEKLVDVEHALPGIKDRDVQHISLMPDNVQKSFVHRLLEMLSMGFIHMDNHIGNLGFVEGNPVLFDFGFTVERPTVRYDMNAALAFSIFQILEHCPYKEVVTTRFWRTALKLVSYKGAPTVEAVAQIARRNASNAENVDLYVGCYCYLSIFKKTLNQRYDSPLYDIIYDIRKGLYAAPFKSSGSYL